MSSQKKLVLGALCVAVVATMGLFVSRRAAYAPEMPAGNGEASVFGSANNNGKDGLSFVPPASSSAPIAQENAPAQPPVSVPYRGHPADEVRPIASEVAGLSEERRQKLYGTIQNDGTAVKKDPNLFNVWIELGLLKKIIGDYEGARDAWEYAGAIRPKNAVSFANLGEIYASYLKNPAKAEKNFKIAIANQPNAPGAYITLSDFYSAEGRAQDAIDILLKGNTANPKSVDIIKMLGRRYGEVKNYTQAILWWQKVLALEPGNAAVAAEIDSLKKMITL